MQGLVYKSVGKSYTVRDDQGRFWNCHLRGKFRIDKDITSSNPIAVGDHVTFVAEDEPEQLGTITGILPRNNYIVRISPQNRKYQKHIIASNIDQAVLIATFLQPSTSLGFIDRFLITCEAYHIRPLIVFNKKDLMEDSPEAMVMAQEVMDIYTAIGYSSLFISARQKADTVVEVLKDKISLLFGHSGVGKSTLLNHLFDHDIQKVQSVSDWSSKGRHTTTFAEMFDLPRGGQVIDTPGIKEFGIVDIEPEELSHYFAEMKPLADQCRFHNCLHENEPQCAVKHHVAEGLISEERYLSYRTLLDELKDKPPIYN